MLEETILSDECFDPDCDELSSEEFEQSLDFELVEILEQEFTSL